MGKRLVWNENGEAEVGSVAELDALLDELGQEGKAEPFIVELVGEDGGSLAMGVGSPVTVLNYVPASLDPPYQQSKGKAQGGRALTFSYRGEWSEVPPDSGVPVEDGRAALRQSLETGELPSNIRWQEV